jgi:hypothetical protein
VYIAVPTITYYTERCTTMPGLPVFPAKCNVFSGDPTFPDILEPHTGGSPRLTDQKCEVIYHPIGGITSISVLNVPLDAGIYPPAVMIYFPKGTDIRGCFNAATYADTIVTEDGWTFVVIQVYPCAHGFPNEFLVAICYCTNESVP